MTVAALTLGLLGAACSAASATWLWRMDPEPYTKPGSTTYDGALPGLTKLVTDQGKAAALAAVGALLTAIGLVLSTI